MATTPTPVDPILRNAAAVAAGMTFLSTMMYYHGLFSWLYYKWLFWQRYHELDATRPVEFWDELCGLMHKEVHRD